MYIILQLWLNCTKLYLGFWAWINVWTVIIALIIAHILLYDFILKCGQSFGFSSANKFRSKVCRHVTPSAVWKELLHSSTISR